MDGLGVNPLLTAEFVKFLNAQLQECKDQLQRVNEENASLKQVLESVPPCNAPHAGTTAEQEETISDLAAQVAALKGELAAARSAAEVQRKDAASWRERYESVKGSNSTESLSDLQRKAAVEKVMRTLKEDLALYQGGPGMDETIATAQKFEEFSTFMSKLSGTAPSGTPPPESRVVFDLPKLQILPKAAIAACDGGFAFFSPRVQWCPSPSQNALLICPTRHYTPHAPTEPGDASWSQATEWASLVGQRREIFDVEDGRLVYVGTFLLHAGPKVLRLSDLPEPFSETALTELARRTFDPASKSQKTKARPYLAALSQLYQEGAVPAQVLGLQRVGFNERFFAILRKAYAKRGKASARGARARSETRTERSVSPRALGKRAREEGEDEGAEAGGGPSKVRKAAADSMPYGWDFDF